MKRADALVAIKAAGYHGDSKTAVRLYAQHNISRAAYQQAYAAGERAREAGVGCTCVECRGRSIPAEAGA